MPGEECASAALDDVLRAVSAFLRAERTLRTYPPENQITQRVLSELGPRLAPALPLDLFVSRDQLIWEGTPLLEGDLDRSNLPARLYRDGVRRLQLLPGLAGDELRCLVALLATAIDPDDLTEDYVTRLWEAELPHVRVTAIDPYLDLEATEDVLEGEVVPTDQVEDVGPMPDQEPIPLPPDEAFRISAEDKKLFAEEVARAEANPPWPNFIAALFEQLRAASTQECIEALVRVMEASFYRLVEEGRYDLAVELSTSIRGTVPHAADLPVRRALERMSHPDRLRSLQEAMERGECSRRDVERLVLLIAERVPESACALLASAIDDGVRRFYADILIKVGGGVVEPALENLLSAPPELRAHFIRILSQVGDPRALPGLLAGLDEPDPEIRKEALRGLARLREPTARKRLLTLALADSEASVRIATLRCLGSARTQLGSTAIIARLESSEFRSLPEEERDLLFVALGSCGGPEALAFLSGRLQASWIPGRNDPVTWRRTAAALAQLGTPEATAILETGASSRNRELAAICGEALASRRTGA